MKKTVFFTFLTCLLFSLTGSTGFSQTTTNNTVPAGPGATINASVNFSTRLFKDKDDLTSVIIVVPSGSMVEVIDTADSFLRVRYEGTEGFIQARHASLADIPARETPEMVNKDVSGIAPDKQDDSGIYDRLGYLTDKYGEGAGKRIFEKKIWKGMTGEMIIDSWGNPSKISRVISGDNVREEWSYNKTWLFLSNDRLTEWGPAKE